VYPAMFLAFFFILPVKNIVEDLYKRRYCYLYGHRLETLKGEVKSEFTFCKRCGFQLTSQPRLVAAKPITPKPIQTQTLAEWMEEMRRKGAVRFEIEETVAKPAKHP